MNAEEPLLSIIIPAYNEARRLPQTLPQVADFVLEQPYAAEVLVVNNNSADKTRAIADEFAEEFPFIHVCDEPLQGKGAAVRRGVMAARGDFLFIADADLSMPIGEVNKFLTPEMRRFDVTIGSREIAGAVRYGEPEYRHIMGRVFNFIVRLIAVPGFHDTQAGFKCFRHAVAVDLFSQMTIHGWAFDVEVLYIALRRGFSIAEVPINWHYRANSRIHPLRDSINMLLQVLKIRLNGLRGRYETEPLDEQTLPGRQS